MFVRISIFLAVVLAVFSVIYFWPGKKSAVLIENKNIGSTFTMRLPFNEKSNWTGFQESEGQFIPGKNDTWFVYGWFGPIKSITSTGGTKYPIWGNKHDGIDFSARTGLEVRAAAPGKVIFTGNFYGNTVRIAHQDGFETTYGHLLEIKVKNGQDVKAGQVIGTVDASGTTNPHLHFELDRKTAEGYWAINPRKYLVGVNWQEIVVPNFPANYFYEGPSDPAKQPDFSWPQTVSLPSSH